MTYWFFNRRKGTIIDKRYCSQLYNKKIMFTTHNKRLKSISQKLNDHRPRYKNRPQNTLTLDANQKNDAYSVFIFFIPFFTRFWSIWSHRCVRQIRQWKRKYVTSVSRYDLFSHIPRNWCRYRNEQKKGKEEETKRTDSWQYSRQRSLSPISNHPDSFPITK